MSTARDSTVMGYPIEHELATYSSSSTFLQSGGAAQPISTLLPIQPTKENYFLWKSLFISVLRASDMLDLAEGREQCPPQSETLAHTNWIKRDQTLLTWINSSLSVSLLASTAGFTSGRALWLHLEKLLSDHATTHVRELRNRLTNLDMRKEPHSTPEETADVRKERRYKSGVERYLETAKEIADGLEAAGSPVDDSEFVSCVLNGLTRSYEGFVASIRDRPEPLTREELQKSLLTYKPESRIPGFTFVLFLFVLTLVVCLAGGISFIFPLVLFVCVLAELIWDIILSSSKIRESAHCEYMKLHTESV
ncbi:hypothetical protein ACLB2K_016323 [Fragaria x ananassa]